MKIVLAAAVLAAASPAAAQLAVPAFTLPVSNQLSDEAQAKLFEPFFTTKPAGDGLGLGLAISAGIIRDFGGSLHGANHAEGGAVFTLELPLAPAP